jgi:ankyrin repeat protein
MAGTLPKLPASLEDFIPYLSSSPNGSLVERLSPYKEYEAKLRELYAQDPGNPLLIDPHCNAVPLFDGNQSQLKIRARDLSQESESDKSKFIMPLSDALRKPDGTTAVVPSLQDFRRNFNIFSESSVSDLDWSNVVAAGSSVLTPLLPVPGEHGGSKRAIRNYYHGVIAPASDVDLFLYGLTEEQALEKIVQIERSIKNTILTETTTVRTKNCITIASKYPIRHVQIVLRIYKSVSEILTGFDVDCSCVAYDGKQVYATPRAISALVTQINEIDISRRSPSYEARLSKYSHRGFEAHWADLDRSRIDPTIFERSFARTVGLARLLVLEKLPTNSAREKYRANRREERGRPSVNGLFRRGMRGNIKDAHEDEIADWVEKDDISNYHTFTIPYGEKFHARKIERLFYAKDLLLNAEWNKKDREVNLHRHPVFVGDAKDVFEDCCGSCPVPRTAEELKIAEEEAKTYISGKVSFLTDDPGRQAIGSFNPITDTDWAEMAYVGNTGRLCQAIVDEDLAAVEECLVKDGIDPNRRDYTGRTPLHLAVMSSSPAVVKCLLEHGAYIIPRLADGQTALHLAVIRGNVDIIKALHEKNEEHKLAKLEAEKAAETPDDEDLVEHEESSDADSEASGDTSAYVKVEFCDKLMVDAVEEEINPNKIEPKDDVLDPNAVAWDTGCAAHHLAITFGQRGALEFLLDHFGSDPNIPIKLMNTYVKRPSGAILSLVLALTLPPGEAKPAIETLLKAGAKSSQADFNGVTAFQYFVHHSYELLEYLIQHDVINVKSAINWVNVSENDFWRRGCGYPLKTAIQTRNGKAVSKLLALGASPVITYESWMRGCKTMKGRSIQNYTIRERDFQSNHVQPIILAIRHEQPSVVAELLESGADVNTLSPNGWRKMHGESVVGTNVLDEVRIKLKELDGFNPDPSKPANWMPRKLMSFKTEEVYTRGLEPGSYKHWATQQFVQSAKDQYNQDLKRYRNQGPRKGIEEQKQAVEKLAAEFRNLEKHLIGRGAKTFVEHKCGRSAVDLQRAVSEQEDRLKRLQEHNQKAQKDANVFNVDFGIDVPEISHARMWKYLELFDAAWNGNLDIIRKLTTEPLGDEPPLLIAVADGLGNNPFSIAILRGHLDLAMTILAIASAQYVPEKKERSYEVDDDEDCDSDSDSESEGEPRGVKSRGIRLHEKLPPSVRNQFTIDDIGQISTLVQSPRSPLTLLRGHPPVKKFVESGYCVPSTNGNQAAPTMDSLLQYAIYRNDKDLFLTLLNATMKYEAEDNAKKDDHAPERFTMVHTDFTYALQLGRFEFVSEMMKRTGVGIPFDHLVKLGGFAIPEKTSTQYQGLSIRGKKKKAWARAYGIFDGLSTEYKTSPPLLLAAYSGSLESVEWLFSDAPIRLYGEYLDANKQYPAVEAFSKLPGGAERAITQWLDNRSKLSLFNSTELTTNRSCGASLCNSRQVRRRYQRCRIRFKVPNME